MQEHSYALVLLDLMLPGITGEAVLEEIRKKGNLPVIVLTAKDSLDEKVKVLTSGADDYITKPFEIREVLARIQVQLRHTEEKEIKESNLSFREMVLNKATFQVSIGGKILPKITRQEFAILDLRNILKQSGESVIVFIYNLYSFFTIYLRLIRIIPL